MLKAPLREVVIFVRELHGEDLWGQREPLGQCMSVILFDYQISKLFCMYSVLLYASSFPPYELQRHLLSSELHLYSSELQSGLTSNCVGVCDFIVSM